MISNASSKYHLGSQCIDAMLPSTVGSSGQASRLRMLLDDATNHVRTQLHHVGFGTVTNCLYSTVSQSGSRYDAADFNRFAVCVCTCRGTPHTPSPGSDSSPHRRKKRRDCLSRASELQPPTKKKQKIKLNTIFFSDFMFLLLCQWCRVGDKLVSYNQLSPNPNLQLEIAYQFPVIMCGVIASGVTQADVTSFFSILPAPADRLPFPDNAALGATNVESPLHPF